MITKFKYVDSLRGIAILAVVFIHAGVNTNSFNMLPTVWKQLINYGQYGVQLFFITSAYTLFLSLKQRERLGQIPALDFFIRRFFRIAPLYYAGIIYYTFERFIGLKFLLDGQVRKPVPTGALLSNIFFVHGSSPSWINGYVPGGWSITVEMTFYLFVPFLFKKIRNINQSVLLVALSLIIANLFYVFLHNNPFWDREFFLYCFFPNQIPIFAFGILAFFLTKDKASSIRPVSYFAALAALTLSFFLLPSMYLIFGIAFVLLVVLLSHQPYTFFVNNITSYLGKISYSIYITHFAVIMFAAKFKLLDVLKVTGSNAALLNLLIRFIIIVAASALLSTITYQLIELPFQKLGKKLITGLKNKETITASHITLL